MSIFKPFEEKTFRFHCHRDIACFNKCCAKLQLLLTPYDIVRIKNRLGVCSDEFLEIYTDTVIDQQNRFPMVRLKMKEDGTCPFVTKEGCTIYEDRPGACRLYPLGRASQLAVSGRDAKEKYFLVQEDHCLGFQEDKTWTLKGWLAHQGLDQYRQANDQWLEIVTSHKSFGTQWAERKFQMFFMASYNLDRFRKFIFDSRFFDLFQFPPESRKRLETDDLTLLGLGFDWLKFSLFGEKTFRVKFPDTH